MSNRDTTLSVLVTATDEQRRTLAGLLPEIYDDLRARAGVCLGQERPDHTLQPTALAHEAYLGLMRQDRVSWENREHVLAVAALLMRRILVDHAKRRGRLKRGGDMRREPITMSGVADDAEDVDIIVLDDILNELGACDEQQCRIVELRYFGGLSVEQTAKVLGVSRRTILRKWAAARAWLRARLAKAESDGS